MQLALVYVEACLIAQYVWQIPTRLRCGFATPQLRFTLERIGLHANALRCLPLFATYLATLMHSYSLAHQKVNRSQKRRKVCISCCRLCPSTKVIMCLGG